VIPNDRDAIPVDRDPVIVSPTGSDDLKRFHRGPFGDRRPIERRHVHPEEYGSVGSASTAGGAGSRMWFYARSTIPEKRVSSTELILICLSFRSHRPYQSKRLKTHSLILWLFSDTSGLSHQLS
jgi:hypothetical protein